MMNKLQSINFFLLGMLSIVFEIICVYAIFQLEIISVIEIVMLTPLIAMFTLGIKVLFEISIECWKEN